MHDIEEIRFITLYLGEQCNTKEEKKHANINKNYTLMSHVGYEDDKGWKENKKKVMYVVPKLSNKK